MEHLLGGEEGETLLKVVAALPSENALCAGAGAVLFYDALRADCPQHVQIRKQQEEVFHGILA